MVITLTQKITNTWDIFNRTNIMEKAKSFIMMGPSSEEVLRPAKEKVMGGLSVNVRN